MKNRINASSCATKTGAKARNPVAAIWLMLVTLLCIQRSDANAQTYCQPQYNDAYTACNVLGITLDNFSANGDLGTSLVDHGTVCDGSGYQDRRGVTSTVSWIQGHTFTATVTTGAYASNCQVWVDFNDNGIFESTETIGGAATAFTGTTSFDLSVPAGAATGVHSMRVRVAYYMYAPAYPAMDPCSDYTYGEAQDYNVEIELPCAATTGSIAGSLTMCEGATSMLTNTVSGGTWSSSNPAVAAINSATGLVDGLAAGTAVISYSNGSGCYAKSVIKINPLPANITGTTDMCMGNTTTLSCFPAGGFWTSGTPSIVTVDSFTGVVTSRHDGASSIIYTLPTGCRTSAIVNNPVSRIKGATAVCSGVIVTLADVTAGGTWSSSDAAVAPITASGVIVGGTGGAATLSYTMPSGCYRTLDFIVADAPPAITGNPVVCVGNYTTLSTTAVGGTWSAASSAATSGPSGTGIIYGLTVGTNTISYALSPSCRTSVVVTVNAIPQNITGTTQVCLGNTATLATYSTGGTWSSADESLAKIDPFTGVFIGIAPGTLSISYTFGSTGCARVKTITVNPIVPAITGPTSVCAGSSIMLANSATNGVSWTSSNTAVATVAPTGLVTGISEGVATITFTVGAGCIATYDVVVNGVPSISGASALCIGGTTTLDDTAPGGIWSSSNSKATVDANGVVTAVSQGGATISYTTGACSATRSITINPLPNAITGNAAVCVSTTTTLTSIDNVGLWSSSIVSVATIDPITGVVQGLSTGVTSMTYTVTFTGCSRTVDVTVTDPPGPILGTAVACSGSTAELTNWVSGGSWISSNTAIATVDATTGVVTGVGAGTATITYAFGPNCRVTTPFTTHPLPALIGGTASVCMPVTSTLADVTNGGTWSSANTSIATVGSAIIANNGVLTGVSTGTTDITYTITSTGCYRTTQVTVNLGLNPGTIIPATQVKLRLTSSPTATLVSTGVGGGTWSSSNTAVATVNPSTGLVTGIAAGSANITYSISIGECTNYTVKNISVVAGRDGDNTATDNGINLYPNPTTGAFTIVAQQPGDLRVFTIDGREVSSYAITNGANEVALPSGLAAGIYMCRFTFADGSNTMIRLVYEH